ncbi:MAG: cobalt-zinc-cadmium resistance protein [Proteobacteria bacterium]|nr:cobalt-zinc-cadmium resistance protein [Pseudomonadota bacterium]
MRRALFFLLAFVLLAQFSWASAAAYCQHERTTTQASGHWGHHEHAHPDLGQKKSGDTRLVADSDCTVCHASCVPPLRSHADARLPVMLGISPPAHAPPPRVSMAMDAPDRPQWRALA